MPSIGRLSAPTWAWRAAAGVLAVIAIFWGSYCYGKSKYDEGRRQAEIAHTDSVRRVITKSIDSVHKSMEPVLSSILKENEEAKAEARQSRIQAANAIGRASRAEDALEHLPDSIRNVTPPEVRSLIDSLTASSAALRISVQDLAEKTVRLQAGKDSAIAEAVKWKALQERTRAALDTAALEIHQLQQQKKPPRCGFKCGFVAGAVAVGGIVTAIVVLGH